MNYKKIFWGVILVIIGVLFLLNNLGISYFSIEMIVRLWPLLLVFWGVSLLPVKDNIKLIISIIILLLGIFISSSHYYNNSCEGMRIMREHKRFLDDNEGEVFKYEHKKIKEKSSDDVQLLYEPYRIGIKNAELDFDAVAGNYNIGSETNELFEFSKSGNLGDYILTTRTKSEKEYIKIKLKNSHIESKNNGNKASIKLNRNPVWNFNFDVGAADFNADFSGYKVSDLNIDGGAASIKVKLGNRYSKTTVNVDAAAASINIYIPETSGCEIETSTFLSDNQFNGFIQIKRGFYQTPDFEDSNNKIYINIDAAVSGVSIVRY